jgi:hypothetical protein
VRLRETKIAVDRFLRQKACNLLYNRRAHSAKLTGAWTSGFRDRPGVYAFFVMGRLQYVGETSSVRDRMVDMLDTRHHVLRSHLGADWLEGTPYYRPASSKRQFPLHIEELLNYFIRTYVTVRITYTLIGRKELEDWLTRKHAGRLYNKPAKRGC